MEKWLEESLKDASQKLHDERVSPVKLDGLYARLMAFSRRSRLGWWNYETIGTTLEYFLGLEHATRLLNHPRESLVSESTFSIWSSGGYLY